MNLNFFRAKSFALDLGNNNTLISDENQLLVSQPSYIVFNSNNKKSVRAVGDAAFNMFEKTHQDLKPIKPLKGGVIADYDSATAMIGEMIRQAYGSMSFYERFDCIISGVPFHTTEVERRALVNALEQFNSRRTYLVYEPLAAALGMGLDIREPDGKMIVDMGGGLTEVVVISLSGIACFQSIKVSGDSMDSDILDYFRKAHNMAIGLRTAEQIKIRVGSVMEQLSETPEPMMVKGKNLMTGIPVTKKIDHLEVFAVLERSAKALELGIMQTLEKCPPELSADIYKNGIYITGGNALLRGLQERIERKTGLPVVIDPTPLVSVSKGVAKALRDLKKYQGILMS